MKSIRSLMDRLIPRAAAALLLAFGVAATSHAQMYGPPPARPQSPSQPSTQPSTQPPLQSPAQTQPQSQAQPQASPFRPEIVAPLKTAEELIRAGKFGEALAKIREAEAIPDRTATENVAIERMRAIAASGAGDAPTANRSFEIVLAAGGLTPAERTKMLEVLAKLNFQAKDYPKAASWASRYMSEGGTNAQIRGILIQSYYLAGDCANAARELRAAVDADAKSGGVLAQDWLELLTNCYAKLGDDAGYAFALEKLLANYPKKEYWADAIRRVESKSSFASHNALDGLRLRHATGTLEGTTAYASMTKLAMDAGLPAEAKRIADEGFASGALGAGADADAQKRLRDMAAKQVVEDQKQLVQSAKAASNARDGNALVNVGFAYVSGGQFDTGIPMMEQGIAKGGLRRPDEAKLHLRIAYLSAGRKADAAKTFQSIGGADGTAELARLWLILARRPS